MLGARVRDKVTGFTGVVTAVTDHLTGCKRWWVEGPANDKGETQERWIDEARIEVIEPSAVKVSAEVVAAAPSPSDCGHPKQ
jgi:heat shock protein HspQ